MPLDALLERNYPVVESTVLVHGAMFMLVILLSDLLYGLFDPRGFDLLERGLWFRSEDADARFRVTLRSVVDSPLAVQVWASWW